MDSTAVAALVPGRSDAEIAADKARSHTVRPEIATLLTVFLILHGFEETAV